MSNHLLVCKFILLRTLDDTCHVQNPPVSGHTVVEKICTRKRRRAYHPTPAPCQRPGSETHRHPACTTCPGQRNHCICTRKGLYMEHSGTAYLKLRSVLKQSFLDLERQPLTFPHSAQFCKPAIPSDVQACFSCPGFSGILVCGHLSFCDRSCGAQQMR